MLVDPKFPVVRDEQMAHILSVMTKLDYDALTPVRHSKGVYLIRHFNFNYIIGEPCNEYPTFGKADDNGWFGVTPAQRPEFFVKYDGTKIPWPEYQASIVVPDYEGRRDNHLDPYGVCDSPEQLLSMFRFDESPLPYCMSLTEIRREHEPDQGGWRWHKWGAYIGTQKPSREYLAHEPDIKSVFCYHIYQLGAKRCGTCHGDCRVYDNTKVEGERFCACSTCSGLGYSIVQRESGE